ncbi:unnamed protein product [Mytilus coruscus]|uniref:BEN domain-containing protein n=1 Tax=Mytilus coruscus TaxID=42192 RepID=A0A6J8DQ33_MYTCO|nr:unnamed protein product [Mytilus coruscus]
MYAINGSSSDTPETAEVLDTGDYLTMKSRETELTSTHTPPSLPSTPKSSESLPNSLFLIRKRKRIGRNDSKPKKVRQEAVMLSIWDVVPDIPLTPTTTQIPDSPLPQPLTPTLHRRILSVHLFNDLPESVRLSEDDLSTLSCSGNNPGALGVLLLKHFYPELFTADQLRIYYSYRGGGKLSKRPLDDSRKAIIKRYVVTLFPSVNTESAYHAMVVVTINQYLCRPVQPEQKV